MKNKILIAFGTRPELIKLAPLILELQNKHHSLVICNTGQHKEMLTPLLSFFNIQPHYNLEVMKDQQSLSSLTSQILLKAENVLKVEKPDIVIVQGDTTTAFTVGLAAFYQQIKVAHVEAGLRTGNINSPFPEEANRKFLSQIAYWHFAPTKESLNHLLNENIKQNIFITGNTSIDALRISSQIIQKKNIEQKVLEVFPQLTNLINSKKKFILATIHRRENHGAPLSEILSVLANIIEHNSHLELVIPVHLNPAVQKAIHSHFEGHSRVHLLPPLDYDFFIWFMKNCFFILTDSGGVQEEAPYLKKPILVLRENTERPEGITAGTALLVGHDQSKIKVMSQKLIDEKEFYESFTKSTNPYGDGFATDKILKELFRE